MADSFWMDRGLMSPRQGYDTMQVCLNGHQITSMADSSPEFRQNHCTECGARTIMACESCNATIRGYYHSPGVFSLSETALPKYCDNCGSPYPWQTAAIESLKEALREGGLTEEDMTKAEAALPDVLRDTARTDLAALKFKGILQKLAKPAGEIVVKILTAVATKAAKKAMGF